MKKIFLLLLLACSVETTYAQTPVCDWLYNATTGGSANAGSIVVDPSGNLFVGGAVYSPTISVGATTLTNTGTENIFLAKYDNMGNPIWATCTAGKYNNQFDALATDPSGNAIITGWFEPDTFYLGTDTLYRSMPALIVNAFVAKYSPSGNVLWATRPYTDGYATGRSVATDNAGNVYVAGYFECWTDSADYIVFGSDTLYNDTFALYSSDIFLVKYSPSGSVLWAQRFGGSSDENVGSVATDAQGNVYIAGYSASSTISFGSYTLNNAGPVAFVAKFDGNGSAKWVTSTGPGYLPGTRQVAVDKYGDVYFAGDFASDSLTLGPYTLYNDTVGNTSTFMARLDTSGNVIWANSIGYKSDIFGDVGQAHIMTDTLANVFVTGSFYGYPSLVFGPDTLYDDTAGGNNNLFIMEYDVSGNEVWATTASGAGNYFGLGISRNDSGAIYLCGYFGIAAMDMAPYSLPDSYTDNTFMAKLTPPQNTAVPITKPVAGGMNVYPVPAFTGVHVVLTGAGYSAVQVFDMAGRQVWSQPCNIADANISITIPTTGITPGNYIVEALRNGQAQTKKIVVQ